MVNGKNRKRNKNMYEFLKYQKKLFRNYDKKIPFIIVTKLLIGIFLIVVWSLSHILLFETP